MAIRTYVKSQPKAINLSDDKSNRHVSIETKPQKITLWSLTSGIRNEIEALVSASSIAGIVIPAVLIFGGVFIIGQQAVPDIIENILIANNYYDNGTTPLVAGAYITERSQYLSDPGAESFRRLTENALKQNIIRSDPVSNNYRGTLYLTVPSLGFNRIPVEANVESGVEAAYQSVLKDKLAHFKSTGLPISDVDNNIVIYGHSARPTYQPSRNDAASAFSFLSEINIGDKVEIEMEGKTYKFIIARSKIVEPQDVSIITGEPGRKTLTIFTCHPRGNNSHRFVAIANEVD